MNYKQPIPASSVLQATTRPLTAQEQQFYSCLAKHYAERVKAMPSVRLLKTSLRNIMDMMESGRIGTIDN